MGEIISDVSCILPVYGDPAVQYLSAGVVVVLCVHDIHGIDEQGYHSIESVMSDDMSSICVASVLSLISASYLMPVRIFSCIFMLLSSSTPTTSSHCERVRLTVMIGSFTLMAGGVSVAVDGKVPLRHPAALHHGYEVVLEMLIVIIYFSLGVYSVILGHLVPDGAAVGRKLAGSRVQLLGIAIHDFFCTHRYTRFSFIRLLISSRSAARREMLSGLMMSATFCLG